MQMHINKDTKISTLLKHHKGSLEAIVQLSPAFNKLRNPVIRKLMIGRTSIAMASKIGGCSPDDFFEVLEKLGFEREENKEELKEEFQKNPMPDYLKDLSENQKEIFDVREILTDGKDPLREIQQKLKHLKTAHALIIVNSFEPVPLIQLMLKQGFQVFVDKIDDDRFETYFYKETEKIQHFNNDSISETSQWEKIYTRFKNDLKEIDVRHLEMPEPMLRILEAIESLEKHQALYVYHKKKPVFLLNELKDRNFDFRIKEVQEGEVYLLIFKI